MNLRNSIRDAHGRDDGFSLVELLTVVIIIGILSAIAMPRLMGQRERAGDASAVAALRGTLTVVPDLLEAGGAAFPDSATSIGLAEAALRSFDFVGPSDAAADSRTVSLAVAADGATMTFATSSLSGECFFLRMAADGTVDRHAAEVVDGCTATAFGAEDAATGW